MEPAPPGPAFARHVSAPAPEADLTDRFREEAVEAVLVVIQDLTETDPLPPFWRRGPYAHMYATCRELFNQGYLAEVPCRHSPTGWRWAIGAGARRSHARFVASSAALVEAFTHELLGRDGERALTNVTFWALLECMRYGLWARAATAARMQHGDGALLAGLDPTWLAQRSAALHLDAYAHACAGEFAPHAIRSAYDDFYVRAVDALERAE